MHFGKVSNLQTSLRSSYPCSTPHRLIPLSVLWPPLHPKSPELVRLFSDLMCKGVAFPPVRAVEGPPDVFRIVEGTHRAAASKLAGFTHVPCTL